MTSQHHPHEEESIEESIEERRGEEEKKNFNSRVLELTASPPRREAKKGEERTGNERGQDKGQEGEAKEFGKNFPNFGRRLGGRNSLLCSPFDFPFSDVL